VRSSFSHMFTKLGQKWPLPRPHLPYTLSRPCEGTSTLTPRVTSFRGGLTSPLSVTGPKRHLLHTTRPVTISLSFSPPSSPYGQCGNYFHSRRPSLSVHVVCQSVFFSVFYLFCNFFSSPTPLSFSSTFSFNFLPSFWIGLLTVEPLAFPPFFSPGPSSPL